MSSWIYRWIPVNRYDVARMESWLEDLSEKGLELAGIAGPVGLFREVPARRRKCRLEPADQFPEDRREEELLTYIRCGWEAVADIEGVFYVFMSTVSDPVEVHTDPVAQSFTYRNLVQKQWFYGYEAILVSLLYTFILAKPYVERWGLFGGLLKGQMTGMMLLLLANFLLLFRNLQNVYYLVQIQKRLKRGEPISRKKTWKGWGRSYSIVTILVFLCLIGGVILSPWAKERKGTRNYEEIASVLPVLALEQVEGEGFVYDGRKTPSGVAIDNSVYYYWALLAPESYEIVEKGRTAEGKGAKLKVNYCKTAFAWLAKGYCQELLADYEKEGAAPKTLAVDGIEEGWIWEEEDGTRMLFRKGKQLLNYYYEGPKNLANYAQAAVERLGQ